MGGLSLNSGGELRRPFESLETDVSRKGMMLSFSISMVKRNSRLLTVKML